MYTIAIEMVCELYIWYGMCIWNYFWRARHFITPLFHSNSPHSTWHRYYLQCITWSTHSHTWFALLVRPLLESNNFCNASYFIQLYTSWKSYKCTCICTVHTVVTTSWRKCLWIIHGSPRRTSLFKTIHFVLKS